MLGRFCVVAVACSALAAAPVHGQLVVTGATPQNPEISVNARGEIRLPPTFAVVLLGVVTRMGTAAEAASQNAARVAATLAAIRAAGVSPDDVSNEGYALEQAYEENGRRRGGFTARNSIRVRVNRIDQVGTVIDAAISGGATDIFSVQFGAANIEEARRSAITAAVKNARADAVVLATAAGGTLGRLISLSSSSQFPGGYGEVQLLSATVTSGAMAPTVVAPRDLNVMAAASARWEFVPGATR